MGRPLGYFIFSLLALIGDPCTNILQRVLRANPAVLVQTSSEWHSRALVRVVLRARRLPFRAGAAQASANARAHGSCSDVGS